MSLPEDISQQKIERGNVASALLANPAFRDAMIRLKENYIALLLDGKTLEVREDMHRYVRLMDELEKDLISTINTGMLTDARIRGLSGTPTITDRIGTWLNH